jgi:metal-responsive CopG/Arc/MetJ family transcriptional regulator
MAKVMISLPDELLARVDSEAKRRMTTRSGLLALAVANELDRRDVQQVDEAIARSRKRFRRAGSFDATDLVRAERDRRP